MRHSARHAWRGGAHACRKNIGQRPAGARAHAPRHHPAGRWKVPRLPPYFRPAARAHWHRLLVLSIRLPRLARGFFSLHLSHTAGGSLPSLFPKERGRDHMRRREFQGVLLDRHARLERRTMQQVARDHDPQNRSKHAHKRLDRPASRYHGDDLPGGAC